MSTSATGRNDLRITLAALIALLAWDATGWDLTVARWFGGAAGFAWRDAWWASTLLHDGGRLLAWLLLAALVFGTLVSSHRRIGPNRHERWRWIGTMLVCVLAVPMIKRLSGTSCPWDLAEFGGVARYVSHWHWGVGDGGGGHCFPSGHAVAAFAFFGMYFLWRRHDAAHARRWLVAVLLAGALFGFAQLARGAHYPSHTLWSAWLCWTLCSTAAAWRRRPSGVLALRGS